MHSECFQTFETNLIAGLAQQARYKQAGQRVPQNDLWGENAYTLVYKLCTCECTKGVIRLRKAKKMDQLSRTRTETGDSQDTGYSSSPSNYNNVSPTEGARHVNGKSNGKMKAGLGTMKEFDVEIKIFISDSPEKSVTLYHPLKLFQEVSEWYDEILFVNPSQFLQGMLTTTRVWKQGYYAHDTDFKQKEKDTLKLIRTAQKTVTVGVKESQVELDQKRNQIRNLKEFIANAEKR